MDAHRTAVLGQDDRLGRAGLGRADRAEQLLEALVEAVAELPAEPDHEALGAIPAVDVRDERVAGRGADRLLGADDVPAERLVAVEVPLPDVADVAARRVGVHVHLLDDHALLALDLVGVEARVAEHVDEHVERDVAGLGGALHVVAGELLAGERVELPADRVDLGRDVPRRRTALGALEEHVLGEVRDPTLRPPLVARARCVHEEARDGLARASIPAVRTRVPLESVVRSKVVTGRCYPAGLGLALGGHAARPPRVEQPRSRSGASPTPSTSSRVGKGGRDGFVERAEGQSRRRSHARRRPP